MKNRLFPNLFIVGAPKCGTTSMYRYLQQHPKVFFPEEKEPGYFDVDHLRKQRISTDSYLDLYQTDNVYSYKGDASPMYLISKKAAEEIKKKSPQAKIIIMIRNPIEMVYSRFLQNLLNGVEHLSSFTKALDEETIRKKRKDKAHKSGQPIQRLFYSECAAYTDQIKRYWDTFGKENVFIVNFEDFVSNTPKSVSNVLRFLGLSAHENITFELHNPASGNFSNRLQRWIKYPHPYLRKMIRSLLPQSITTWFYQKFTLINNKEIENKNISLVEKLRLLEMYSSEIDYLSDLLEYDFSHWKRLD